MRAGLKAEFTVVNLIIKKWSAATTMVWSRLYHIISRFLFISEKEEIGSADDRNFSFTSAQHALPLQSKTASYKYSITSVAFALEGLERKRKGAKGPAGGSCEYFSSC